MTTGAEHEPALASQFAEMGRHMVKRPTMTMRVDIMDVTSVTQTMMRCVFSMAIRRRVTQMEPLMRIKEVQ